MMEDGVKVKVVIDGKEWIGTVCDASYSLVLFPDGKLERAEVNVYVSGLADPSSCDDVFWAREKDLELLRLTSIEAGWRWDGRGVGGKYHYFRADGVSLCRNSDLHIRSKTGTRDPNVVNYVKETTRDVCRSCWQMLEV